MNKEKFTFFYKNQFSQFYHADFTVGGIKYCTCEQYMMAEKARLFGDSEIEAKIMATTDPFKQKELGREVRGFSEEKWNAVARDVVYRGNYAKYKQNPDLFTELIKTKGTTMVEASPTDRIWGIGLAEGDIRAESRAHWRGTNWLGQVLTKVRDDLEANVISETHNWDNKKNVFPVKIINKMSVDLWGWDLDKITDQVSKLSKDFPNIGKMEVTTRDDRDKVEVELSVVINQKETQCRASGRNVMDALFEAVHQVRQQFKK